MASGSHYCTVCGRINTGCECPGGKCCGGHFGPYGEPRIPRPVTPPRRGAA